MPRLESGTGIPAREMQFELNPMGGTPMPLKPMGETPVPLTPLGEMPVPR
jgi:hypothetical protein